MSTSFIAIGSIFVFRLSAFFYLFIYKKKGFYQCGPASVEAIRKGQVGLAYDVAFVLASVNAGKYIRKIERDSIKSMSIWFTFILQIASIGKRTKRRKSATFKRAAIVTSINEIYFLLILYLNFPITPEIKLIFNKLIVLHFGGIKELVSRFLRRNPSSSTRSVNRTRMTSQTRTNHQRVSKLLANGFGDSIEVQGSGLRCSSNAPTNQPRRRKRHSFRVYTYIYIGYHSRSKAESVRHFPSIPNRFPSCLYWRSGSNEERISLLTAVGSSVRAKRFFRYPEKSAEDVIFDLIELERIPIGESFNVIVTLEVSNINTECIIMDELIFLTCS